MQLTFSVEFSAVLETINLGACHILFTYTHYFIFCTLISGYSLQGTPHHSENVYQRILNSMLNYHL